MKFCQDGGGRHLGFVRTVNKRSIRCPRKPCSRTKHEVDRITRCRDMAIRVSWGTWNPILGEGEVVGVSDGTIRKSDCGSYRLSIVTVALFTICNRMSPTLDHVHQQGVGHFGPKFPVAPVGVDP